MIMRRIRAALGMAVTWGAALSCVATTLLVGGLALGVVPSSVFGPREVITLAVRTLLSGALGGGVFAIVLAGAERRRTFATLTARRAAVWGFVGGVAIPAVAIAVLGAASILPLGVIVGATVAYGAIGSGIAAASVKLARRAPELAAGTIDSALPVPRRSLSSTRSDIE